MATMQVFQETGRVSELKSLRNENAQLRNENEQLRQQVIEVTTILIKYVADKVQTH